MKNKEIYICNGKMFYSFEELMIYCEAEGWVIGKTETIHGVKKTVYLITITVRP